MAADPQQKLIWRTPKHETESLTQMRWRSLWGSAISEVWGNVGSPSIVYLQGVCLPLLSEGHMQPLGPRKKPQLQMWWDSENNVMWGNSENNRGRGSSPDQLRWVLRKENVIMVKEDRASWVNSPLPPPSCRMGTACGGGRGSMCPAKQMQRQRSRLPQEHRKHTTKIPINIWAGGMWLAGNKPVGNLAYLVHRLVAEISSFQDKIQVFQ